MFMAGEVTGRSEDPIPVRVWCSDLLWGTDGRIIGGTTWVGNVFAEDQSTLDAIAADAKTAFAIPINVDGLDLSWDSGDLDTDTRNDIVAWISSAGLGMLTPTDQKPADIARYIMEKVSGKDGVDALGFRIHWGK
jgi:hypothetical protein